MGPDLSAIKAIALDIDGVLTDGGLIPLENGDVLRVTDAKDAFAVRFAAKRGIIMSIMSGGNTVALHKRMLSMHIREEDIFLGCRGKLSVFRRFCEQHGLDASEVAYFGDDIADTLSLELRDTVLDKTLISPTNTKNTQTSKNCTTSHRTNCGIHTRCISTTGEDTHTFNLCHD